MIIIVLQFSTDLPCLPFVFKAKEIAGGFFVAGYIEFFGPNSSTIYLLEVQRFYLASKVG